MTWNVYCDDINRREIRTFDVFKHGGFKEDVEKALKKCKTIEEFSESLKRSAMYYFWSKCEWEIVIGPLFSRDKGEIKIDVYDQLKLNWEHFVKYVWECKKK